MAIDTPTVEEILSAVRAAAKRVTVAKRTVAEVLVGAQDHLTADEITRRVQDLRPDVSPSTVYRILEEFENLQIVVHSHLGQQAALFHLAGPVHGHLICDVCAHTVEIPARHFDALSKDLQRSYGFSLDRHHVAVSGTCATCQSHR
jgi:Fur family ferric uptake transcriptional regulator